MTVWWVRAGWEEPGLPSTATAHCRSNREREREREREILKNILAIFLSTHAIQSLEPDELAIYRIALIFRGSRFS